MRLHSVLLCGRFFVLRDKLSRGGPAPPAKGSVVIYPPSPPIFLYSREWAVKGATHRRLRRPALYGLPRLCYFPGKRRGYILQSRPLSHDWERAGGLG